MKPVLLAVAFLVAQLGFATASHGSTWVVDQSGAGDFETIQEAVDVAVACDSIVIRPGEYQENVVAVDKSLTFVGEGIGVTIVEGVDDSPTFRLADMTSNPYTCWFCGMTIRSSALNPWAVYWNRRHVKFRNCLIDGAIGNWGGADNGTLALYDCEVSSLLMFGDGPHTELENSIVDSVRLRGDWYSVPGAWLWGCHEAQATGCQIGSVRLEGGELHLSQGVVGYVEGDGFARFMGADSDVESVHVGAQLQLIRCEVTGDAVLEGGEPDFEGGRYFGVVHVDRSVIHGQLRVDVQEGEYWAYRRAWVARSTILGDFTCDYDPGASQPWGYSGIRSNIVMGYSFVDLAFLDAPLVTHNDFAGGSHICQPDSAYANMEVDPLFCGPSDYQLQECSPCAGAGHDGGDIGANGVGCQCYSFTEHKTWGSINSVCSRRAWLSRRLHRGLTPATHPPRQP
jgi:hypothetical protein